MKETVKPIACESSQLERYDYTYSRNGTANIFMLCNPIEGQRQVKVTERRTAIDYAHILKELVDVYYPEALLITVVQDQLNTHSPLEKNWTNMDSLLKNQLILIHMNLLIKAVHIC